MVNTEDIKEAKLFNKEYSLLGLDMAKAYRKMYPTLLEMGTMRTDALWHLYARCPKVLKPDLQPLVIAKAMQVFDELDPGHFFECARNLVNAMGGNSSPPKDAAIDFASGLMEALEQSEFFADLQEHINDSPNFDEGEV